MDPGGRGGGARLRGHEKGIGAAEGAMLAGMATVRPRMATVTANKKATKQSSVVLTRDIPKLGQKGSVVQVKTAYARNYLKPQGLAEPVTQQMLDAMKSEEEKKVAVEKKEAVKEKVMNSGGLQILSLGEE